jgi:hypothetical protein
MTSTAKSEVVVEMPAAQDGSIGMLTPLPEEKQLEVTFTRMNCWVPATAGPASPLASLKKLAKHLPSKRLGATDGKDSKAEMKQERSIMSQLHGFTHAFNAGLRAPPSPTPSMYRFCGCGCRCCLTSREAVSLVRCLH